MAGKNRRTALLLALIALAGLGVRFYGLGWGLPYHFHSDEFLLAANAEKLRTASSLGRVVGGEAKFLLYPPLLMFIQAGLVSASTLFRPFAHDDPASLTLFYLLARGIVAVFGAATVLLLYLLGARLYSRAAGLLAAFFLAFTVLHVRDSHFFCTDVPMTFFLVLILYLSLDIAENRKRGAYLIAGIATGVAVATKQTAVLAVPLVLAAHLLALWRGSPARWPGRVRALLAPPSLKKLAVYFAAAALALMIANPFLVMYPGKYLAMSRTTLDFVQGANQPQWTFQFTGATAGYWFSNLLYYGMGPALEALSLLGVLWALWRRRRADLLALLLPAVYFAAIGFGYMKFIRYAIPLLPFLCLLGARLAVEAWQGLRSQALRFAAAAATALVGAASLFYCLAYLGIYARDDVRVQASRWIRANVPAGATIAFNTSYATPLLDEMFTRPQFFDSYTLGYGSDDFVKKDYYTLKALNFFTYASRSLNPPDTFRQYIRQRLADADFIVMSDEHSEQYAFRPREYPAVVQFFRRLYAERMGFRLVKTFVVTPSFLGLAIDDSGSELSFRLFDHPRVRVFQRVPAGAAPGAPLRP